MALRVAVACLGSVAALGLEAQQAARASNNLFPRWSPDGARIVFTSERDGDPEIYVMRADGSHAVRLTYAPGRDAHPFFSHDGRRIVFQSPRANGEDTNIDLMDAHGSHGLELTHLKDFAGVPVFSPDERTIAFQWRETSDFPDPKQGRIFKMDAKGGHLPILTPREPTD